MSFSRQGLHGIIIVSLTLIAVIGSALTAVAESNQALPTPLVAPTQLPSPTSPPQTNPLPTDPPNNDPTPTATSIPPSPTITEIPLSQGQICTPPEGWLLYSVKPGDTLESLSAAANTSQQEITEGNCLSTDSLPAGSLIFLPPITASPTPTPSSDCGPPNGWVQYTVQKEDNLYQIGLKYNITTDQLEFANCKDSSYIIVGEKIWVPGK